MADLDALLGIVEEPNKDADSKGASTSDTLKDAKDFLETVTKSSGELAASSSRDGGAAASSSKDPKKDAELQDAMRKIVEKAKIIAEESGQGRGDVQVRQEQLKQEFESLLGSLFQPAGLLDKADVKKLKDSGVFGPSSFWVTEMKVFEESEQRAGILVRGNLREERSKVFSDVIAKVKELFGDKYEVLLIEDPEGSEPEEGKTEPRIAFQIAPAALVQPPQTTGWKRLVAAVLLLLLFASCLQLSLVANITKLPKETLDFFSNPANLESDQLPPGLENWDPSAYLDSALPIFSAVLAVNFAHEMGHRVAAYARNVKLGPSYFIPNLQLGSFGAITPFMSLLKDRVALWDVAAAGPLAGGAVSLVLLGLGLSQSHPGVLPAEMLVPVPTQLFQGSLLLGSAARFILGDELLRQTEVLISPLTIAGWCGLISTALQLLPVGSLDGGRMMQAAFGKQTLALSSFFTYVGLGLGFLGSSLSLPFGLYVLICQREAERFVQDNITPANDTRRAITTVAVITAILILIPMAPEIAESVGVGSPSAQNLLL